MKTENLKEQIKRLKAEEQEAREYLYKILKEAKSKKDAGK